MSANAQPKIALKVSGEEILRELQSKARSVTLRNLYFLSTLAQYTTTLGQALVIPIFSPVSLILHVYLPNQSKEYTLIPGDGCWSHP
eukprot:1326262-Amorphochlora_amoeboformis.AAC.1